MPAASRGARPAPVGGFFETQEPGDGAANEPGVLAEWTATRPFVAYANARSALAALAALWPETAIWLPAFICADVMDGLPRDRVRFYPVADGFEPDLAVVDVGAKAGDLVVLLAAFGLPVGERAAAFAAGRDDLRFVEDRAQALAAGPGPAAGYKLYSPRKLLGVADGGLLVAPNAEAALPQPTTAADAEALWRAPRLRSLDPLGADNARWHTANQAKEAGMRASPEAITPESLAILHDTPIATLADARLANWRILNKRLSAWSALPDASTPPLGYVLRLDADVRDRLLAALHAERIFAAVHWPHLASPAADFPREHAWTRELVTLPCDHRYGSAEMLRIAERVVEVLR